MKFDALWVFDRFEIWACSAQCQCSMSIIQKPRRALLWHRYCNRYMCQYRYDDMKLIIMRDLDYDMDLSRPSFEGPSFLNFMIWPQLFRQEVHFTCDKEKFTANSCTCLLWLRQDNKRYGYVLYFVLGPYQGQWMVASATLVLGYIQFWVVSNI